VEFPEPDHQPHLGQVVPSMLAALGVAGFGNTLGLAEVTRACVLLIDGMGWELLAEYAEYAPVLTALAKRPLQVGFPSTTSAGLAALGTGLASGEHGMTGYTFEVPGAGVVNALRWSAHPGGGDLLETLIPEEVQPLVTTFERAAAAGITTSVVNYAQFKSSGLTRAVQRGGRYVGVHALGDLVTETLRALESSPSFCYSYHSELDMLGHLYGPGSAAWRMQLRQVDRLVESIVEGLPPGGLLAVVADHGMVSVDGTALDIEDSPELLAGVRALGGEVRARHVYTEEGAAADVLAAWRETLGGNAWVAGRDEATAAGWFGPAVSDRVRPRIGDVVVAARDSFGLLRRASEPFESRLLGHHGSLTSAEQLVPLVLAYG
jgi:hypothetical protein